MRTDTYPLHQHRILDRVDYRNPVPLQQTADPNNNTQSCLYRNRKCT